MNLDGMWTSKAIGQPREALRTGKEMAAEFGISVHCLAGFISSHSGPKPRRSARSAQWYSPSELRKWWATVQRRTPA